jgi:hypothetical protein
LIGGSGTTPVGGGDTTELCSEMVVVSVTVIAGGMLETSKTVVVTMIEVITVLVPNTV